MISDCQGYCILWSVTLTVVRFKKKKNALWSNQLWWWWALLIRPATEMNIVLTAGENPFQLEVTEYHHDPQLVNIHQFFPALEHNFARAVSGRLGEERQVNHSCQKGCTERGKIQVCWFSKYEKDCVYYTWKTCAFWFLPLEYVTPALG